jgi:hypothetical protein
VTALCRFVTQLDPEGVVLTLMALGFLVVGWRAGSRR